ncbi:hypothetical protein UFOVP265_15 [uncultured Caudovirales phage]|jgi:hypothetical protein|uniref:Uncharacterized protein n=1 Tax=uncultured Caudovirales phage TaxID=2100421 RepID=A0A6J5LGX6_9CAUD|nr:hypothetical protein UFOVP265_15 [uncultured Caudovirales phage]
MHMNKTDNNDHETRIAKLELVVNNIYSDYFKDLKETLKELSNKMDHISYEMRKEISELRKDQMNNFKWIISSVLFSLILPIALKMSHLV